MSSPLTTDTNASNAFAEHSLRVLCSSLDHTPFEHVLIDDFLTNQFASKLIRWGNLHKAAESTDPYGRGFVPLATLELAAPLIGPDLRHALERVFCVSNVRVTSDNFPGIFITPTGHSLEVHSDYVEGVPQLACLLYLNPRWAKPDGGELCLWQVKGEDLSILKRYEPIWNRFVAFRVSPSSFHSVTKVATPAGRAVLSLNFFFDD